MAEEIRTVGVLGCGTMGSGISEVCARAGYQVVFREVDDDRVADGLARIRHSMERAVSKGKLDDSARDEALGRISGATTFESLKDADFVIEAIPERLDIKQEAFTALDGLLQPHAIIATNTSSLPVIEMAVQTSRPARVIGFHFFNPAPVMGLVELVKTVVTEIDVLDTARAFAQSLEKEPVVCGDRAGFIANLLLFPYLNNAVRMLESGFASREDIDAAMQLGCAHPMGPLALLDLVGLDSVYEILDAMYRQFRETVYAPAPLIKQLTTAGFLGRKTGRGFYEYEEPDSPRIKEAGSHRHGVPETAASHVRKIGVLGSGTMALGIAEVAAKAGFDVVLRARSDKRKAESDAKFGKSLAKAVERGKMTQEQREAATAKLTTTTDMDAFASCDVVIEAIAEDLDVKLEHFRQLDAIAPEHAILSSTTSSLPVIALAAATNRPENVAGMHFFNPAQVMKLVEVVRTVRTSDETADTLIALGTKVGKHCVACPDRAGFIVNALLFPYINDAIKMLESGYATAEDIDKAMKLGCGHPMGPFALADIVGLDVTYQIIETLYAEFREPGYAPAPMLEHLVHAGYLGRKTGRGFYTY
ncbi:MAG: 3-hydroxyacyl-CoA dehydrogenase family protein [Actinomycetota bacterium]|nr:3-hydroxyacyl-CoA dehydrogenase family protein [Actinomycetota bacterium]